MENLINNIIEKANSMTTQGTIIICVLIIASVVVLVKLIQAIWGK